MQKSQVKTLVSETGRKVEEEKYMIGVDNDVEVVVRYTYEFANGKNAEQVVYQTFQGEKRGSGNYTSGSLNVSNYDASYFNLYAEISNTCEEIVTGVPAVV